MFNRHWTATPGILCQGLKEWTRASCTGVASPKIFWGKMFDFMRITQFCLENRLSKHKMTIFSKNLRGHGPFRPPPWLRLWLHEQERFFAKPPKLKRLSFDVPAPASDTQPTKVLKVQKRFRVTANCYDPPPPGSSGSNKFWESRLLSGQDCNSVKGQTGPIPPKFSKSFRNCQKLKFLGKTTSYNQPPRKILYQRSAAKEAFNITPNKAAKAGKTHFRCFIRF